MPALAAALAVFALLATSPSLGRPAAPPPVKPPFEVGMVAGTDDAALAQQLGVKVVRHEWDVGTPVEEMAPVIAAYAAHGISVLPLAGFHETLPTRQQELSLESWAAEFGPGGRFWRHRSDGALAPTVIEFGNETSYGYQYGNDQPSDASYVARAKKYALKLREAQRAVERGNPAVGILAQADDGDTGSPVWVDTLFATVPDLGTRVTGWTIHPYGPRWPARIDRMEAQLAAHGVTDPEIWVTEWGLATDGGRCLSDNYEFNRCLRYPQAGATLLANATGMRRRYGRKLRAFFVYQVRDSLPSGRYRSREGYFGAFHSHGAVKGAYTRAMRALMHRALP